MLVGESAMGSNSKCIRLCIEKDTRNG